MGVLGLWDLLESVGHPVKIEGLEGKVLGVDANIWLYKFIRGFRERDNATNIESHKLGLFNRICKLLFYRIKPVFVFDGPAPVLKRRTLERRQNIRNKHLTKHQDAAMKILANQLKSQYPNAKIDDLKITMPNLISNNLVAAEKLTDEDRDLFYLPETGKLEVGDSDSDESDDPVYIGNDFHDVTTKVDIHSKDFGELPPEVRYEILQDVKLSTKRIRNSGNLPEDANSFSNFQLERLKARRKVQQKIEECEKEICTNYTGELADGTSIQAFRVQSDAQATILYRPSTYYPEADVCPNPPTESTQQTTEQSQTSKSTASSRASSPDVDLYYLPETGKLEAGDSESDESDDPVYIGSNFRDVTTKVDIQARDFGELPPEARSEILEDVELSTKRIRNSGNLPEDANSLSPKTTEQSQASKSTGSPHASSSDVEPGHPELRPGPANELKAAAVKRGTNKIVEDAKESPRMFDTPYIDAADEAEAQCANAIIDDLKITIPDLISDNLVAAEKLTDEDSDLFYLPETGKLETGKSDPDESDDPIYIGSNLCDVTTKVDFHSKDLGELPPEARSEILEDVELSTKRIQNSGNLPEDVSSNPLTESSQQTTEQSQTSKSTASSHIGRSDVEPGHSELRPGPLNEPKAAAAAKRVTNKIVEDAKELLRLFGIPYIDAAGEAEAQCAKLEELKLTEGTITDDSDIWLFGAQNVFRYFFNEDKYVMQYKMTDIEFHIRMTRENLVCFAMMVGSDYTDGIMNIGHVTAVEVLSEFPGDGLSPLIQFRDWHKEALKDLKAAKKDVKRRKLLKYKLPDEFPSRAVYEGYLKPVADTSTENFTWGMPELDELREYARRNFGWDPKKVDEKLVPVMKRLNEKKIQKTIDTFFFKTQANRNPELFRSKRVNQALNKIAKRAARDGGPKPALDDTIVLSEEDDD